MVTRVVAEWQGQWRGDGRGSGQCVLGSGWQWRAGGGDWTEVGRRLRAVGGSGSLD